MILAFIASLLILALFWWLWHPLGAAFSIVMAGYARAPVVARAAFWDTRTILIVGVIWGLGMAIAIREIISVATSSHLLCIAFLVEGVIAVHYIGFQPAPEDRFMYNKAG